MLDPELKALDSETAIEPYTEFEAEIHQIALRQFVSRLRGEPPILLTAGDVSLD
jgi:hypothetical protein